MTDLDGAVPSKPVRPAVAADSLCGPPGSFFWHDYETFGRSPRRDRPSQFAGVRTDADLNEIDAPVMHYCKPAPDFLPEPEACLLTGITPQLCLERGLPEHRFAETIAEQFARPGTVGVGYNTIRFDDEVTRHLFWRNLIDPYAREWQNECGRWDLLDVVRCAWALRPEGIEWPVRDDGSPSLRLEHLAAANGLLHETAHDAQSDVRATIGLARLVKHHQPRLWDFCLNLRSKHEVAREMAQAQAQGRPFLHISAMYGSARGALAPVWPLAPHPTNRNEVIVWDLSHDPSELFELDVETIRLRMFTRGSDLPEGVTRLPIKTIHLNKSPIVIANLKTLSAERAAKWGHDIGQALRHAEAVAAKMHLVAGMWPAVFERPPRDARPDVDEDLYGGMIGDADRRRLQGLRGLDGAALAARRSAFDDPRLDELLFRYRARNFPESLDERELVQWADHRVHRLHDGVHGGLTLQTYFDRIDELGAAAEDDRTEELLGALIDYGTDIAPERD